MESCLSARLILNGKSAQLPEVREAVFTLRDSGFDLGVVVTWEAGDARRFACQSVEAGVERIIAGGGDGTVNEVVNGLMSLPKHRRVPLGILPLGSANDFANGAGLPLEPLSALDVALKADPREVDVARLGEQYFLNVASCGIGAEVTSTTPEPLKRVLGGSAYSLMGALKGLSHHYYRGKLSWPEGHISTPFFLIALCNGSQAGGGQSLAPSATLDDGLLDVLVVRHFNSVADIKQVLTELESLPQSGDFVSYFQTTGLQFDGEDTLPITLDGESFRVDHFAVELMSGGLELLLPSSSSLLSSASG